MRVKYNPVIITLDYDEKMYEEKLIKGDYNE
jgi:hypothetical protein